MVQASNSKQHRFCQFPHIPAEGISRRRIKVPLTLTMQAGFPCTRNSTSSSPIASDVSESLISTPIDTFISFDSLNLPAALRTVDAFSLNEENPDLTLGTSVEPPLDEHEYDARIAVDPDEATAWCGKAKCRLKQGDYIAAVEFAAAALARSLDTPDCSLLLIEAAARAGDRELLGLTMQRHIRLFPADGAEAIRHLVPSKLIALSSPNGTQNEADLADFEQILCTVRDRRPRRYGQLLQCLLALRPRCILEIGVFNGRNAVDMIRAGSRTAHQAAQLRYIGFDLFEDMTLEVHEKEFSKYPLSRAKISEILSKFNQNHQLIQGYTQDTLLDFHQSPDSHSVDFVFIDGGHSEETIESDWNNVAQLMSSRTVVIFDDFYLDKARELDGLGCNSLVERLTQDRRYLVEMMPVSDSFDKDFGVLTVALVKVRLRPASSGSHSGPAPEGAGIATPVAEHQSVPQSRQLSEIEALRQSVIALQSTAIQLKDIVLQDANIRYQAALPNPLNRFGRKAFSQSDEDGILLEIVRRLEISIGTFAEFGVGNGLENNTIILGGLGWRGFWVGRQDLAFDPAPLRRLTYIQDWITRDNAPYLAQMGLKALKVDMLDVVSVDLDGNDIYIVDSLLTSGIAPKIFIVEYNAKFPPPSRFQIEYDPDHRWRGNDYFGASLQNFVDLFKIFGYILVCCNARSGVNAFFVREDYSNRFPEVPKSIGDIHVPPRYYLHSSYGHRLSPRVVETLFS